MNEKLEVLRKQIDGVDKKIISSLAKRASLARKIGKLKKEYGISALDMNRWNKVLESTLSKAEKIGLSKIFIKRLYDLIHKYSLQIQKEA